MASAGFTEVEPGVWRPTVERFFGARVRELREAKGMSQADLAEAMTQRGVRWHQTTVAKSEKGQRPIRLDEAALLAELLFTSLPVMLAPVADDVSLAGGNLTVAQAAHRLRQLEVRFGVVLTERDHLAATLDYAKRELQRAETELETLTGDLLDARKELDEALVEAAGGEADVRVTAVEARMRQAAQEADAVAAESLDLLDEMRLTLETPSDASGRQVRATVKDIQRRIRSNNALQAGLRRRYSDLVRLRDDLLAGDDAAAGPPDPDDDPA